MKIQATAVEEWTLPSSMSLRLRPHLWVRSSSCRAKSRQWRGESATLRRMYAHLSLLGVGSAVGTGLDCLRWWTPMIGVVLQRQKTKHMLPCEPLSSKLFTRFRLSKALTEPSNQRLDGPRFRRVVRWGDSAIVIAALRFHVCRVSALYCCAEL